METFWTSAGLVALAEIGDKTQLLTIVLAARFGQPLSILAGILAATLANHAAAAALGFFAAQWLSGPWFQAGVGAAFLAMAAWALLPDKADESGEAHTHANVFLTTLTLFFLVEIGDKTQIATSLLAARFHDIALVTLGTTLGMMAANTPAVLFGGAVTRVTPLAYVRIAAALVFAAIGVWMIAGAVGAWPRAPAA